MSAEGRRLFVIRIVAGAMLAGEVMFAVVALSLAGRAGNISADVMRLLWMIDGGLLALLGTLGVVARIATAGSAAPERYMVGVLMFMALIEGPVLMGLVLVLPGGPWAQVLVPPAIGIAIQGVGFPRRVAA